MVTTERDESRHSVISRVGRSIRNNLVRCIKLLQGHCVIQHGQRSISTVNNRGPFLGLKSVQCRKLLHGAGPRYLEQISAVVYAPSRVGMYAARSCSDTIGSKSSTWPCRHASIERSTQDSNVVLLGSALIKTVNIGKVCECSQARKLGSGDVGVFKS